MDRPAEHSIGAIPMTTADTPLEAKTVQELQTLAADAAFRRERLPPPKGLSRAARLHLIDQLSRWGGSGLALLAGAAIFIALVVARDLPLRTSIWASMIFAALYLCRRYRKGYRRGDRIASHPFRWRAYYTSALAVVSAAFGAGAFLLLPKSLAPLAAGETLGLIAGSAAVAAAFHAAHRPSAAAAGLPAFAAALGGSAATFGAGAFTMIILGAGVVCAVVVAAISAEAARRAARRFPRTSIVRREAAISARIGYAEATRAAG